MPLDRHRLVVREWLAFQPCSPDLAEHVGMRTARNQMRVQNGMHLVLDPRAMADDLVAPGHQPTHAFGLGRRRPDFGEKSRRVEARQKSSIDLVRLHVRMRDRLDLKRIGNHHPCHEWRQDTHETPCIPGRLDDDLICRF